ncbi:hypothetical protein B1R94_26755 [Mycolicibacterium litorale]|nr:hypothetical protein B1R94_26755 [Mycolicibacterium litorale]
MSSARKAVASASSTVSSNASAADGTDAATDVVTATSHATARPSARRTTRVYATAVPADSAAQTSPTAAAVAAPAADPAPSMTSWLPSTPIVAGVAVTLAQQQIADAQSLLTQQTWGSGNVVAGMMAVAPQAFLAQAAWSLNTWKTALPGAQAFYADTAAIPIVHQLAGVNLLGTLLLPSLATASLAGAGLFLPLVGAVDGTGNISSVQNLVDTAAANGRVYGFVPVTMKSTTEPVVYISVNGGPSVPVLVDTGSSGLVLTRSSVNTTGLGSATGSGTSGYSGGLTYAYDTYTTTVDFGNGIVSEPTSVNIVKDSDAQSFLSYFAPAQVVGVLGIGANAAGPGPSIPTTALPGELSDGVFLYQGLFFGAAGVMVLGPNPLPTRVSVPGAPIANVKIKINNGSAVDTGAIIDSGGVYGTMLTSIAGNFGLPAGTVVSVYTADGVLLYSYTITSANQPSLIHQGYINTGYTPFQQGPIYINYTAPDRIGSTDFDYA